MIESTGSRREGRSALPGVSSADRLDPMLVREYRRLLRSPLLAVAFLGLHAIALLISLVESGIAALLVAPGRAGAIPSSEGLLAAITSLVFGLLLPLAHFQSLRGEFGAGRNAELLMTAGLSPWQIVGGRVLAATGPGALLLISILPYWLLRYFLGGFELIGFLGMLLHWLFSNLSMNAIVIGGSAYGSVVGRVALIIGCLIIRQAVETPYLIGGSGLVGPSSSGLWAWLGSALVALLFAIAGCQVGVARLKPVWRPGTVPDSSLVLVMLLLFVPIIHSVAFGLGGVIAGLLVLMLLIYAFLRISPFPFRKKRLKPIPPATPLGSS
jgi:hypothetical protein